MLYWGVGKDFVNKKVPTFVYENKLFKNFKKEYDQCFKGCFNKYKKK